MAMPTSQPKRHEVPIKGKLDTPYERNLVVYALTSKIVKSCGIYRTDLHIHNRDFDSAMPVVTGHETSEIVVMIGENVKGFRIDDKITADNSELCGHCHLCRQGKMFCYENFLAHGVQRKRFLD